LASVQMRYDANADGRIDSAELALPLTVNSVTVSAFSTSVTGSTFSITRGQFAVPQTLSGFDPTTGILQFTANGGTASTIRGELAITGPLQYSAYLTNAVVESDKLFQVVLSPLTTLAADRFQYQLMRGTPEGFDIGSAYEDHLNVVANTLGLSTSAETLMSVAPERDSNKRLVAELQANVLLNVLVSLASGMSNAPSDAASLELSASVSSDISQRLAQFMTSRGSFDFSDVAQLKLAMASVLPDSLIVDDALSNTLARLMTTYTLVFDSENTLARAVHTVLPDLSRLSAGLNTALNNGELSEASLQSEIKAGIDRLIADLGSALIDSLTGPSARIVINATGAWFDLNLDGRIDAQDKVNGALIAADFGAGKNADPVTNRLSISQHVLPSSAQAQVLGALGADDRAKFVFDTGTSSARLDLKWSAAEANAVLNKQDILLTARGGGSSAALNIGKLPAVSSAQGVTANLGALLILAAGDAKGFNLSRAEMTIGLGGASTSGTPLGGNISGPVRVHAAGQQAIANVTAISNTSVQALDLYVVATGTQSKAGILLQSGATGILKTNLLTAASYAERSTTEINLISAGGNVVIGSQLSALSAGDGSSSAIWVNSTTGAILLESSSGTNTLYGGVSAIATGTTLPLLNTDLRTSATVKLSSVSGNIRMGSVNVLASGANSVATVIAETGRGTISVNGPVTVEAEGAGTVSTLSLSAYAPATTGVALTLASSLNVITAHGATDASTVITFKADQGGMVLQGAINQSSLAAQSSTQSEISLPGSITIGNEILLESTGTLSSAKLSFTTNEQLTIATTSGSTTDPGIAIQSSGHGSTALLDLSGDVTIAGDVLLERDGAVLGEGRLTQLAFKNVRSRVDIQGDLKIAADQSAAGGIASAIWEAGKTNPYRVEIEGDLTQDSIGYGSRARFYTGTNATLSALDIAGDWKIDSTARGNLVALDFGSHAAITLGGAAPSLHIGGALHLDATGDFARTSLIVTNASPGAAVTGSIDHGISVEATGYGSRSTVSIVGSSSAAMNVGGDTLISAQGAGSAATLDALAALKITGNISVKADSSVDPISRAIASAAISMDGGSTRIANVDAVNWFDIAVLRVNNLSYGGQFNLGSDPSVGQVYLQLNDMQAANIKINFWRNGIANILLGSKDIDMGIESAKANMLTIEGWREGLDKLIVPSELTRNGFNDPVFSTFFGLDAFLNDAIQQFAATPNSASSRTTYDVAQKTVYIAYDLDGTGLTGLISIMDPVQMVYLNFDRQVSVPAVQGINSSVLNIAQREYIDPRSLINSNESIALNEDLVVTADVAETNTLTFETNNGRIVSDKGLAAIASAYRSQVIIDLTASGSDLLRQPRFFIQQTELRAEGLLSNVSFTLTQDVGTAVFNAGIKAIGSGDGSRVSMNLQAELINIKNTLLIQATGSNAQSEFSISDARMGAQMQFQQFGNATLEASGFQSEVTLKFSQSALAKIFFKSPLQIVASGPKSISGLQINYKKGE
ncbi:MAG: beta strand repeat-containing protein, partial [Burkholderiaceae bacterium]